MRRDERHSTTSKRSRETEAKAVAFIICNAIGLETCSASQDYIQRYERDAKLLTESLEHVQKTATQILNVIGAEVPSAPSCLIVPLSSNSATYDVCDAIVPVCRRPTKSTQLGPVIKLAVVRTPVSYD